MAAGSNSYRRNESVPKASNYKPGSTQQQIVKRQLRIIDVCLAQIAANPITRHVERFTHRIKMKPDDSRRQTHRWDATLLSEAIHRGFAHLKYFSELVRGQEFFTIFHCRFIANDPSAFAHQRPNIKQETLNKIMGS